MGRQGVRVGQLSEQTGMESSSLSRKLRGETALKFIEALSICEALHVTIPTLLGRVDDMAAA